MAQRLGGSIVLVGLLTACAPSSLLMRTAADQLAVQASAPEDDLELAREASAFYLKLAESVLASVPDHLRLAEAVASGFTQYAYAFVAFEAERLESRDAKAAQRLRQRAAQLYWRAYRHAWKALSLHSPALAQSLSDAGSPGLASATALTADQVGVAYWAAASWGAFIALSKDRPDTVADLPQVVRLVQMALATSPNFGEGALLSLMGTLEAARPGGSTRQAEAYLDRASAAGAGRHAGPAVAKAEAVAQPAGDKAGFEALLREAIVIADRHPSLANAVMRERAQWLLDTLEDRF